MENGVNQMRTPPQFGGACTHQNLELVSYIINYINYIQKIRLD